MTSKVGVMYLLIRLEFYTLAFFSFYSLNLVVVVFYSSHFLSSYFVENGPKL